MGRLAKKLKLGLGNFDSKGRLQLEITALSKVIDASSALQRIMRSKDWVHVSNVFTDIQNDALNKGKAAEPSDDASRQTAMAKLNVIDEFNMKIHNTLTKGEDALKRLPDLKTKLRNLEDKSG